MDSVTLYHNPRCSKSREALRLLEEAGYQPHVLEYLKTPLSYETLAELSDLVGGARQLIREQEPEYSELFLADVTLDERHLLEAIQAHPRLLQRPIVVTADRAVIARPPELALSLLPVA